MGQKDPGDRGNAERMAEGAGWIEAGGGAPQIPIAPIPDHPPGLLRVQIPNTHGPEAPQVRKIASIKKGRELRRRDEVFPEALRLAKGNARAENKTGRRTEPNDPGHPYPKPRPGQLPPSPGSLGSQSPKRAQAGVDLSGRVSGPG